MGEQMIYLDNAATTEPDGEALSRAEIFAREEYFNPSALYGGGLKVSSEIKTLREELIRTIADPEQFGLIFTSCGTESDNHAIFSCGRRGNAVTTEGEHAAVFSACTELGNRGVEPRFAPLNRDGSVKEEALLSLVDEKTSLVSVVHVNNETGAVNDVSGLARKVKEKNSRCVFHSDGVQAFGKLPFRLPKEIDLYSVSAHKIGGLKGTGALFKRKGLALRPFLFGGGQEGTLRSGTEDVLGILDFCFAARKKFSALEEDFARLRDYRERLWGLLDKEIFVRISPFHGDFDSSGSRSAYDARCPKGGQEPSPYILTVAAKGLRGEILQRLAEERGVIVGTGSACSSKKPYSRVIEACGWEKDVLGGVLRLSFSSNTTEDEITFSAEALNAAARELKARLG